MAFDSQATTGHLGAAAGDMSFGNQLLMDDRSDGTLTTNQGFDDRLSMRTESIAPEQEEIEAYNREKGQMHA